MNEIQAEVVNDSAVAIRQSQEVAPAGLFGVSDPVAIIGKASDVASALKSVIAKQGLISRISGKEYPRCEAWTLLGTMLGVFPVLTWTRAIEGGWEARVEAKTRTGDVIGAAEAQCLKTERNWANRDDFALRSMAQTRATAKCLRMPLGFVMTLAGYEPTPAEEMTAETVQKPVSSVQTPPRTAPTATNGARVAQDSLQPGETRCECLLVDYKEVSSKPDAPKPWTAWFCKFRDGENELEAGTFDKKIAERLETLKSTTVELVFKASKKPGKFEIVSLEPSENIP